MRALCPLCGFHHTVVRVLEEGESGMRREVYQLAAAGLCPEAFLTSQALFEATAKFGLEAIVEDDDGDDAADPDAVYGDDYE